jgi:hypothetical protein
MTLAMRKDIGCGAVLLVVAAVFWTQRGDRDEVTARFPDFVLVVLALLGITVIVRGLLRRAGEDTPGDKKDRRFLVAAIVLMLLWALGMGLVGFTISGVLAFVVIAQLIRRARPSARLLAQDGAVAVVLVVACFFVFTKVLLVPLPVSVLIGM